MSSQLQSRALTAAALTEGRAPVRERLTAMLLLTALLHAVVILGLSFSGVVGGGGDDSPQLDVLLVTDQVAEAEANEHAAYLAQRTQLGSGNSDAPLPPASPASRGATAAAGVLSAAAGGGSGPAEQDPQVLTSTAASGEIRYLGEEAAAAADASMPQLIGDTEGEPRSGRGDAPELLLRGQSNAEHWVTPDTRASRLAPYLAAWKRKVERVGTLNFPSAARSAGLSGSPVLEVEIGADGRLRLARVRRSSGYGALDEAALTILKLASPFDPFPADLGAEYSRLRFAYQWEFVAGALQTGAVTPSSDTPLGP
jgi:protein TonB